MEASPIVCKTQQGGMIDEVKDKDDEEATRDQTEIIVGASLGLPSFLLRSQIIAHHRAINPTCTSMLCRGICAVRA